MAQKHSHMTTSENELKNLQSFKTTPKDAGKKRSQGRAKIMSASL